jgi:hypothetical protein
MADTSVVADTRTLSLGEGLEPPAELLLERGFVAGSPRTGKTNTCGVLVEEADRHGIPSVVITPVDVWHGLRTHADGEQPGLEHVLFGGSFADRPLQVGMGRGLARAAADGLRMVLTTARMSLDDRATLVADFLEELLEVNRSPLLVVIEEGHRFAPAGAGGTEARKRCREAVIAAIATGRMPAYLGVWIVTQRLAMLATDARELCNASIVHKLRGANDLRFARPWLEDFLEDRSVLERLTKLRRGEAIVVAPDEGDIAGLYQLRPRWTFDSSNSDDALAGVQRQPKGRSSIDLSALDATLGEALREAEEHDPETLRRRVAALQSEVQKLRAGGGGARPSADVAEADRALRQQIRELEEELMAARSASADLRETVSAQDRELVDTQAQLTAAREAVELVAALRRALTAVLGDVSIAEAESGAGYPGDEHVLGLIRAHAPAAGAPTLQPVEALRAEYLERTAQRLVDVVRGLADDEREALLFLIARQAFTNVNAVAKALSGHDGGGARSRWSKALGSLESTGLVAVGGSGRSQRRENVESWVRSELGPHAPTDQEIAAVRDRALSVLHEGEHA